LGIGEVAEPKAKFKYKTQKIEQMTNRSTEGNFANTLLGAGYSSCEVCFNVKLKRKGIMKWLEDKKFIKPKTEGFALMVRDWDDVIVMSSAEPHRGVVSITSTKVNGLR
jgi:Tfp pilus assembly protein PilW